MDLPDDDSCIFFMCSLNKNIPGTWFDIYAVTGTAWNSRIEISFAINRSGIPGGVFDLGALPGEILSVPTGVVLHR